jgi:hypothetical protein
VATSTHPGQVFSTEDCGLETGRIGNVLISDIGPAMTLLAREPGFLMYALIPKLSWGLETALKGAMTPKTKGF